MKFWRPAKVMGLFLEPSQDRKARATAITMGTRVNTAKPMKLGAMKL